MTDELAPGTKTLAPSAVETIPPLPVTVIGTMADVVPKTGTVATTASAEAPNLVVQVVTPLAAVLIRFANTYLTTLSGLVVAGMTTDVIPASDFEHLVLKCATLSVASAGLGLIKDLVTVFGKLEQKYPLLTGSI